MLDSKRRMNWLVIKFVNVKKGKMSSRQKKKMKLDKKKWQDMKAVKNINMSVEKVTNSKE